MEWYDFTWGDVAKVGGGLVLGFLLACIWNYLRVWDDD